MGAFPEGVLRFGEAPPRPVSELLERYRLTLVPVAAGAPIPGSYWGAPEAGLIGATLHARPDTPLHSVLHEAGHFICMPAARRARLHTNAGGDYAEENAVCYLQILLADRVPGLGRDRMLLDMDAWGYSFRLGSARAWFERDAGDARASLRRWGLIESDGSIRYALRQ